MLKRFKQQPVCGVLIGLFSHFQFCGVVLLFAGFVLFTDPNRILLSRLIGASSETLSSLSQPFFYYIALGLAVAGLIAIFASFVGWWATCLNNYCVLSIVGAFTCDLCSSEVHVATFFISF